MTRAIHLQKRSTIAIALCSLAGIMAFGWPLLASESSAAMAHSADAPWFFAAFMPLLLAVVLAQLADGGMNAKSIAMLGVLSAIICVLRPLGAGTVGIEPMWVVLILSARALGPGFGFCLGAISMGASALITGGIGPWLPFQMIAAAWVGLGAGLIRGPRDGSWREISITAAYGGVACYAYGLVMNLWVWPFTTGLASAIAFIPGAGLTINLQHWLAFSIATSLAFDIPRAILTVVLIYILGRPALAVLRRASRRAVFDAGTVSAVDVSRV
jgi:energy-coupling factor transport system substrate-specific component